MKYKRRTINWIDEILDVTAMQFGITVDIMLACGIEIFLPADVLRIIQKEGVINEAGQLIVSRGIVHIVPNDCDLVKIIVGKKIVYEFGQRQNSG